MKYYLGIDGGGSKTAFLLVDEDNRVLAENVTGGCSYLEIGKEGVLSLLDQGIKGCLLQAGIECCTSICIGLPCYGENQKMDEQIETELKQMFPDTCLVLVNDAVVGWAGSLQASEGIHLVAGTGSLALGKGNTEKFARSGGWSEFFGDEGSCYWIGRQGMQLFSKQADGRCPKGALYSLVKEKYKLNDDFEFIEHALNMAEARDQVASFQRIVLMAAEAEDASAQKLYEEAAKELADMVVSVKNQLTFSSCPVHVSYFGGLFHAGRWVLPKLKELLEQNDCELHEPNASAVQGAVLLARQKSV